jgi:hypothetical protein
VTIQQATTEWQQVMGPLRDTPLWPQIRQLAVKLIEQDYERLEEVREQGVIYGITSSDVNHTVFGVARHINQVEHPNSYDAAVLRRLLEEVQ